MEKIIKTFIAFCMLYALLALVGLIVWLLWPYVIPLAFPKLAYSGLVVSNITPTTAIGLVWLINILVRCTKIRVDVL